MCSGVENKKLYVILHVLTSQTLYTFCLLLMHQSHLNVTCSLSYSVDRLEYQSLALGISVIQTKGTTYL